MSRYTPSNIFTCCLWLLALQDIRGAVETDVQIDRFVSMIERNNEKLKEMEASWLLARSGLANTTQPAACEVQLRQQNRQLEVCQAQAAAASLQLRSCENQSTALLYNLTICRIGSVGQQETADSAALALQLKTWEAQVRQLQLKVRALETKLQAYDSELEEFLPQSCLPFGSTTGLYRIKLLGMDPFYVPCDARYSGSGWLVIQRRMDGSVDFYRNWTEYRAGFGVLRGEFFIGLEKLHRLTAPRPVELVVVLEDFEGDVRYAHYDNFSVGGEETAYQLTSLGRYDGNAGNSMGWSVLQKFSTADNDNDGWLEGNCARRYHSAWWYAACSAFCNPNGQYFKRRQLNRFTRGKGIIWMHWHGFDEALKFVQMMIRPISSTNY